MAIGDIGSQLDTGTLGLSATPLNNTGIHLFKVAAGIYILWYHSGTALRAATFAINEGTGAITTTVIDDAEVIATQNTDAVGTVAQIAGTCYVTSNSAGGSNLGYATVLCDSDGNNIVLAHTKTVAHGGVTDDGLFLELDANVICLVTPGSSPDIETRGISDVGAIDASAIQDQESIITCTSIAWIESSNTLVTIDFDGTARTYALNGDGTFDNTVVDSLEFHSGNTNPSNIVVVDDDNGICAVSIQDSQTGNDETAVYILTVDGSRNLSSVQYFSQTATDINRYRPTVFPIGDASQRAFLWIQEGTSSITSVDSDGNTIETAGGILDAATKGPYFVQVTANIGAVAHNNSVTGTAIDITTFSVSIETLAATLSGTIFGADESTIRAGGATLIITLSGQTWDADIGSDNSQTTALINGLDSAQAEGTGWDAVVKAGLDFDDVTRTSDTVVTITLPAFPTYSISAPEIIQATIPSLAFGASALSGQITTTGNIGEFTDSTGIDLFITEHFAAVIGREQGDSGPLKHAWFRFPSIEIDQGEFITAASIALHRHPGPQPGTPSMTIYGLDEDNSAIIAHNDTEDYRTRTRTTASVSWSVSSGTTGTSSSIFDTPDISSIVQEIVNRAGWVSGNAMAFVLEDSTTSTGNNYRSYWTPAGLSTGGPKLMVDY